MNVRVRKTIAILTSALIVPMTLPGLSSTVSAHEEMPVLSGSYEEKTVDAIHAYDPITDLEKERNYRNSVSVVQNKIIFSVIDKRVVGSTPVRLDDKSDLCRKYNLSDTEFIYETIINDSECNAGIEKYEVFYEASIEETDIWEYTDLLKNTKGSFQLNRICSGRKQMNRPTQRYLRKKCSRILLFQKQV